jgi:opacity protein-like surface antigen
MRPALALLLILAGFTGGAAEVRAQNLADYDYENLIFRGIGLDVGYIWPTRVEPTPTLSLRFDLGYLGPAVRLAPQMSYWSSTMRRSELARLAERLSELPPLQAQGVVITAADLGTVDWSDLSLSIDAHIVWTTPVNLLTFVGAGAGVHLLNGRGSAIDDTFIEDLLDTMSAGIALLAGVEYPLIDRFRIYGEARYTLLSDVRYPGLRIGGALMLPPRDHAAETRGMR